MFTVGYTRVLLVINFQQISNVNIILFVIFFINKFFDHLAYVLFPGCAKDILISQSYDRMISYVMRYCDLLLYHQIKPVLVFDGRNLPSKAGTEKKRRQNRAKYKQMAKGIVFLSFCL